MRQPKARPLTKSPKIREVLFLHNKPGAKKCCVLTSYANKEGKSRPVTSACASVYGERLFCRCADGGLHRGLVCFSLLPFQVAIASITSQYGRGPDTHFMSCKKRTSPPLLLGGGSLIEFRPDYLAAHPPRMYPEGSLLWGDRRIQRPIRGA